MKKISVIIPCYNVHNYIQRCFGSIKQQSIGFDELEIILIDDASTDETREDLLEIEREYPDNVLVVTCDENGKLGTARNIGISYASGEYVAFVDADDALDAMMFEKLYRTAKNYSCDIVECGFKTFSDGEELFAEKCGEDYYLNLSGECEEVNRKQLIINSLKTAVWGRLYNRDFIVQNELLFLEKILYEDVHYTGIGMLLAGSYAYVGETLYYYYQNLNGIIKTPTEDKIKQEVGVAHLLLKDIQSRGLLNQVVQHYYNEIVFYFTCKMYIDSLNMIFDAQMGDWRRLAIYFRDNLLALFPEANQNAYTMSLVNNNRSLVAAWRILNDKSLRSDVAFGNSNSDKRIVLLNTHEFINIGDHFITEGTIRFLNDFYPGYELIEISADNYAEEVKILPYFIEEEDILVIVGGGYLGSLWLENGEYNVRDIVLRYRKNKIIIFPQSVYYSDDSNGVRELELSKYVYSLHDNLTIYLREKRSYDYARLHFPKNVSLGIFPDLALYYRPNIEAINSDGIGICLREDTEKKQDIDSNAISQVAKRMGQETHAINMLSDHPINIYERSAYVDMKMRDIASCRLVVTDRLHCMLMCAVTGTPCIAFDNLTGKVSGVYEWIKNLGYISVIDEENELDGRVADMLNQYPTKPEFNVQLDESFKKMAKDLVEGDLSDSLTKCTRIKKFLDVYVPNEDCNLRCHYCYIAQKRKYERKVFRVDNMELIKKAFSPERLGGRHCYHWTWLV